MPDRFRRPRALPLAFAVLCLVAVTPVARPLDAAQDRPPQQPPTFRTGIDLVRVDVVVVDKDGHPVRGLKAQEFALRDGKESQTIATFDEISHEYAPDAAPALPPTARRDVATNTTAQADRLIVMVLDDLHIYRERTDRAKAIARTVVTDLGPQSSMAVLFTSGDHSTQVTTDPSRLLAAIDTLKGRQSWRRPHQANDAQKGDRIDPQDDFAAALAKIQKMQDATLQDFFDNMVQYKTLQDAARMLGAGDARRKAFVLVSEGIGKDLTGLFGAMAQQGEVPQGGVAYASQNDIAATMQTAPIGYHDLGLISMMDAMRRSNVATYAIDPRGRVDSKDLARECFPAPQPGIDPCSEGLGLLDWVSPVRQAQHGLEIMSEASGGFAMTNTDNFTSGLARIVEDLDHYYLLGFYPAVAHGKRYRPLTVTVPGHPDWRLRFRRGYLPGPSPAATKRGDPLVALSSGILPKTDLPLRLTAAALPGSGRSAHVVLALEVTAAPRELQETDGKLHDVLKYEVLAVNTKTAKVTASTGYEGRLTLSPGVAGQALPVATAYQVGASIDLPPGRYELRVSALSAKLAKGGSVYLDIDVPDFSTTPLALSDLVLNYAGGSRVPVAPVSVQQAGPPPMPGGASAPRGSGSPPARQSPMLAASAAGVTGSTPRPLPFPPSLDREFTAADTLRLYFEVSRQHPSPVLQTTIEILDERDHILFSSHDPANDRGQVDARVPLEGLSPGAQRLRVTVSDGKASAQREVSFVIGVHPVR